METRKEDQHLYMPYALYAGLPKNSRRGACIVDKATQGVPALPFAALPNGSAALGGDIARRNDDDMVAPVLLAGCSVRFRHG
jgi:hypothetical protein